MVKLDQYVLDSLMRDLVGHDRRPASYLVYLWLAAEQQRQKRPVSISYSDLAESVGVSKSSAQSAVAWLIHRKLISSTKANVTATPNYTVQTPWKVDYRRTASNAVAGPLARKTFGPVHAGMSGTLSTREAFAPRAFTSGPRLSASLAADGRRTRRGMRSN
jgi:hypothetical protein